MENETDPLAQFGLDAIDLRWTLKHIAAERSLVNKQHLAQLIDWASSKCGKMSRTSPLPDRTRPGRINGSGTLKPLWKPPKSHCSWTGCCT